MQPRHLAVNLSDEQTKRAENDGVDMQNSGWTVETAG